jgi:acetolactate synthase-1/2/3 large subunit
MAMSNADLLIALGVRFDDRVTGRLAAFAPRQGHHVDIDPAEVGRSHPMCIVGDVKRVLAKLTSSQEPAPTETLRRAPRGGRSAPGRRSIPMTPA